jgi:hypothetical protein
VNTMKINRQIAGLFWQPLGAMSTFFRVGEDLLALAPHSPARAQFTHAVLHVTGSLPIKYSDGRSVAGVVDIAPPTARTAPK